MVPRKALIHWKCLIIIIIYSFCYFIISINAKEQSVQFPLSHIHRECLFCVFLIPCQVTLSCNCNCMLFNCYCNLSVLLGFTVVRISVPIIARKKSLGAQSFVLHSTCTSVCIYLWVSMSDYLYLFWYLISIYWLNNILWKKEKESCCCRRLSQVISYHSFAYLDLIMLNVVGE